MRPVNRLLTELGSPSVAFARLPWIGNKSHSGGSELVGSPTHALVWQPKMPH
jgi:hypothetical protein